jgi:tetratricopeptide (TPR) repeat protein
MGLFPVAAAVVAATLLLAVEAAAQAPAPTAGRIISIQGRVEVERAGASRVAIVTEPLQVGDRVKTGPDSRAAILLADETQVKLNANSTLVIKAVAPRPARGIVPAALRAGKTVLQLIGGESWVQSPGQPEGLEVETPVATATIRGTEFNLRVGPGGESRLTLIEGRVSYRNEFGEVILSAGEVGIARQGQPPIKQVLVRARDAAQWTLYYPGIVSPRDYPLAVADRTRLDAALGEARAAAAAAPSDPDAQTRLAEIQYDLGQRAEARAGFTRVLAAHPTFARAINGLGWVALAEGKADAAIARFGEVTPPTRSSLLGLALAHFRRGETRQAAEAVEQSLGRFGPSPAALTQSALFALLRGDLEHARVALDEALRLDPEFGLALGLRSNLALMLNDKDDALATARRAVETNPGSPAALINLSLALQSRFELAQALDAARKAVALDPHNARAYVQLARLLLGFDRVEPATRAAERAEALDPDEPLVQTTLGFTRLARHEIDRAQRAFTRALTAGSQSADPYVGLGLVAFRKGRPEEGLTHFQAAVALEPEVSIYHSYLGKALYQVGRREEGLAELDRARALDPRDPTPELYKGVFLRDLLRPAEAIEALQKSVALNDNLAVYRSRLLLDRDLATRNTDLTRAYLNLGQNERALALSIRAQQEDVQSPAAHLYYGNVVGLGLTAFQPGLSELLQFRVFAPVNQNTFTTGLRYTKLLEAPNLEGTLSLAGGQYGTFGANSVLTGWDGGRIAGAQFLNYFRTDGARLRNDDQESWSSETFFKLETSYRSSLFFGLFHSELQSGDISRDQQAYTQNDPSMRNNSEQTFVELGYVFKPLPESTLVLYGQAFDRNFRSTTETVSRRTFIPGVADLRTTSDFRDKFRQPFVNGQAAYLHRLGSHQLWLGADYYYGRVDRDALGHSLFDFLFAGTNIVIPGFSFDINSAIKADFNQRFVTLVAQDTWQAWPRFYLTGALRYDNAYDGDTISELRQWSNVLSPQAGVLWQITPAHTVRAAAFQHFQTPSHQNILPTNIAGFFLDPVVTTSSIIRQYQAAWDADLTPTTFLTLQGFHRHITSPIYQNTEHDGSRERNNLKQERTGFGLALNQILFKYFGASAAYVRVYRNGGGGEHDGTDDLLRLSLSFVHPSGLSALASWAYVQEDRGAQRALAAPRDFWVGTVGVAYEFPEKWGTLAVRVENPFDERYDIVGSTALSRNGVRSDLIVNELPARRVIGTLNLNF